MPLLHWGLMTLHGPVLSRDHTVESLESGSALFMQGDFKTSHHAFFCDTGCCSCSHVRPLSWKEGSLPLQRSREAVERVDIAFIASPTNISGSLTAGRFMGLELYIPVQNPEDWNLRKV